MDINFVSQSLEDLLPRRPANDLTTAECRISNVIIPKTVLDGGAQPSFIFKKLAQRLGLRIDHHFSKECPQISKAIGLCQLHSQIKH